MAQYQIAPRGTSKYRKGLRTAVRQGKLETRVYGTPASGYYVGVVRGSNVHPISERCAKQYIATLWAYHKLGCEPRKLLQASILTPNPTPEKKKPRRKVAVA